MPLVSSSPISPPLLSAGQASSDCSASRHHWVPVRCCGCSGGSSLAGERGTDSVQNEQRLNGQGPELHATIRNKYSCGDTHAGVDSDAHTHTQAQARRSCLNAAVTSQKSDSPAATCILEETGETLRWISVVPAKTKVWFTLC